VGPNKAASSWRSSQPFGSGHPTPAAAPTLDPDWVYWIVRSVVVKMSPPALSIETIEEIARTITDEITAELNSYTPQG
jgi:hypothetical protein